MEKIYVIGTKIRNKTAIFHIKAEEFNYKEFLDLVKEEEPKVNHILVRVQ